jgi:hypothetical protein
MSVASTTTSTMSSGVANHSRLAHEEVRAAVVVHGRDDPTKEAQDRLVSRISRRSTKLLAEAPREAGVTLSTNHRSRMLQARYLRSHQRAKSGSFHRRTQHLACATQRDAALAAEIGAAWAVFAGGQLDIRRPWRPFSGPAAAIALRLVEGSPSSPGAASSCGCSARSTSSATAGARLALPMS